MNSLLSLAYLVCIVKSNCPTPCRCENRGRVYCNEKRLQNIPYGIPADTKVLYLQNNHITNSPELNKQLSELPFLEKVMLYKNELLEMPIIQSDTISVLEMDKNKIDKISPGSILPNLVRLGLADNHLTNDGIDSFAFKDMNNLETIIMDRNNLHLVPKNLPQFLEELHLSENKIDQFPANAARYLAKLRIMRLQKNALNDESFPGNVFGYLEELQELDMSYNGLAKFPRGMQTKLKELRLFSNKIRYLSRHDFKGLIYLQKLDLAHNNLQYIEDGSLESLRDLESIELYGNNWTCDCYILPLTRFLNNHAYHKDQHEPLVCKNNDFFGEKVENMRNDQLTCKAVEFNITLSNDLSSATISSTQPFFPPFVQFRLMLSLVTNEGAQKIMEVDYYFDVAHELDELRRGVTYQVCLYNGYYLEQNRAELCKTFSTNTKETEQQLVSSNEADVNDLETVIGLLTGAIIVIVIIIIVAVLIWNSNHFPNKDHTLTAEATLNSRLQQQYFQQQYSQSHCGEHQYCQQQYCPQRYHGEYGMGYTMGSKMTNMMEGSMLSNNINTLQLNEQTSDAGPEFDVTIVTPHERIESFPSPTFRTTNTNYQNLVFV